MAETPGGSFATGAETQRAADLVVERTVAIAQVPAPTGDESERAHVVASWWTGDGITGVTIDEAGNVWGCAVAGEGPITILAAHLDTVFPRTVSHAVRRDAHRIHGPGVGDNAVAVAALSVIGRAIADAGASGPVWLVGTVGEEGLGNLRGVAWALDHPPAPVRALVALEGNYFGRVGSVGVGSLRWMVEVEGPGGHAWEAATAPSAIDAAARMVVALSAVPVESGQRSLNVGTIEGGEAVNARARHARFSLDMRAAEPDALDRIAWECRRIVEKPSTPGVTVRISEIGVRPAGRIAESDPLVRAAVQALADEGIEPALIASSTDANAAHPRGVPSVALGVTVGAGEHTLEEWIEIAPLAAGLRAVANTVVAYTRKERDVRS